MSIKTMELTEWILSVVKQMSTQSSREKINERLIKFEQDIYRSLHEDKRA